MASRLNRALLVLAIVMLAWRAHALEMGAIVVHSFLDENFAAHINVQGEDAETLEEHCLRLGRPRVADEISGMVDAELDYVPTSSGGYLHISTRHPIREVSLRLVVAVECGVYRQWEYLVLLDPPAARPTATDSPPPRVMTVTPPAAPIALAHAAGIWSPPSRPTAKLPVPARQAVTTRLPEVQVVQQQAPRLHADPPPARATQTVTPAAGFAAAPPAHAGWFAGFAASSMPMATGWLAAALLSGMLAFLALRRWRTPKPAQTMSMPVGTTDPSALDDLEEWALPADAAVQVEDKDGPDPSTASAVQERRGLPPAQPVPPPISATGAEALADLSIHRVDTVMDLVEAMVNFEQSDEARNTLRTFLSEHPDAGVEPWARMFDLLRDAGRREEFEIMANRVNRIFNIEPPCWDGGAKPHPAQAAGKNLEDFAHLARQLTSCWPSEQCGQLMEQLIRDNRGGTRRGLPLSVVEELMLLRGILTAMHTHKS